MRLFLLFIITGFLVIGCGQKGPLYRVPEMKTNKTAIEKPINNNDSKATLKKLDTST